MTPSHRPPSYVNLPSTATLEDVMGMSSAKKGGMKKAAVHRVGPRRQLEGRHVDGRPLGVALQAVLKDGSSLHRLVAVLKPLQPAKGAPVGARCLAAACG
jgi:hypothetical protein